MTEHSVHHSKTRTPDAEHQARNDEQLALLRRTRPDVWRRVLETLSMDEQAEMTARADRADRAAAPQSEIAELAAELAQAGIDPQVAPALLAELSTFCEQWDAETRRQRVRDLASRGPAAVERRFSSLFLPDGSQWHDDGQTVWLEFPPDRYNTSELRSLYADRLEARDRGDHDEAGATVVAPGPDDQGPPPAGVALEVPAPETAQAVAEARSEALGLRGLWSYQGTAGELAELIAREQAA